MNERIPADRLREAMRKANIEALEDDEETGRQAVAAVAAAIAMPPSPRRFEPTEEEERQRILDAALGDVVEIVNRHRMRLGRRTCSSNDAKIIRQIHELLRSMAGPDGGNDSDPSFQ